MSITLYTDMYTGYFVHLLVSTVRVDAFWRVRNCILLMNTVYISYCLDKFTVNMTCCATRISRGVNDNQYIVDS